jgi:RimJ/RimL family protein N-acetyltransferase
MSDLKTDRIRLRRFRSEDIPAARDAISETDAGAGTTPYWQPLGEERLTQHLGLAPSADAFVFAICRVADDRPIGLTNLSKVDLRQGVAEAGVTIWDVTERGERIGRSALWLVCHWGFEALRLDRIAARIVATNHAALRNSEAIGFRVEGTMRAALLLQGTRRDVASVGLLRGELQPDALPLPWETG